MHGCISGSPVVESNVRFVPASGCSNALGISLPKQSDRWFERKQECQVKTLIQRVNLPTQCNIASGPQVVPRVWIPLKHAIKISGDELVLAYQINVTNTVLVRTHGL